MTSLPPVVISHTHFYQLVHMILMSPYQPFTIISSTLTHIFCYIRRPMKFCKKCSTMGRADNLKVHHFPICQPKLKKKESGFLSKGCLPQRNVEDYLMMLKLVGVSFDGSKSDI